MRWAGTGGQKAGVNWAAEVFLFTGYLLLPLGHTSAWEEYRSGPQAS